MPAPTSNSGQLHIDEALANYERYELLKASPNNFGWAAVLLFYSALHLVEAYKCTHHPHMNLRDHAERNDYVIDHLSDMYEYYDFMYIMSRKIRYKMRGFSVVDLRRLHDENFAQLRKQMRVLGIEWQRPATILPTTVVGENSPP